MNPLENWKTIDAITRKLSETDDQRLLTQFRQQAQLLKSSRNAGPEVP